MRIGVLTCGGDCPGLNAVIYGLIQIGINKGIDLVGIIQNAIAPFWETIPLNTSDKTLLQRSGTILGSIVEADLDDVEQFHSAFKIYLKNLGLDALIVIAGDSGIGIVKNLCDQIQLPFVAIPKTIDNDVKGTDPAIGFSSVIESVTEYLDSVKTTAASHRRIMIAEVMGRDVGYIALYAGISAGADAILIPENPFDEGALLDFVKQRYQMLQHALIVVAEGVYCPGKNENVGEIYTNLITEKLKLPARYVCFGHLQRGGPPSAYDRMIGQLMAVKAMELIENGQFNYMACMQNGSVGAIPIILPLKGDILNVALWVDYVKKLNMFI